MKRFAIIGLLTVSVALTGCGDEEPDDAGLANPAAVFCEEQGGTLDMRTNDAGTTGYCLFDDGSECEEWAYFRDECAPGDHPGS
jgi:inhibitor of cysteine peptidase